MTALNSNLVSATPQPERPIPSEPSPPPLTLPPSARDCDDSHCGIRETPHPSHSAPFPEICSPPIRAPVQASFSLLLSRARPGCYQLCSHSLRSGILPSQRVPPVSRLIDGMWYLEGYAFSLIHAFSISTTSNIRSLRSCLRACGTSRLS